MLILIALTSTNLAPPIHPDAAASVLMQSPKAGLLRVYPHSTAWKTAAGSTPKWGESESRREAKFHKLVRSLKSDLGSSSSIGLRKGPSEQRREIARGHDPRGLVMGEGKQTALVACHQMIGLDRFGQGQEKIVVGSGERSTRGNGPMVSASSFNSLTRRPAS